MITADMKAMIEMMGSDMLREYRDAMIEELAKRNENTRQLVARDNVMIEVHIDDDLPPGWGFRVCQHFVLHPGDMAIAAPFVSGVTPSVYVSARWL